VNTSQNRVLKVDTNWTIKPNLINEGGFGFTRVITERPTASTVCVDRRRGLAGPANLFYNGIPEMDFNTSKA